MKNKKLFLVVLILLAAVIGIVLTIFFVNRNMSKDYKDYISDDVITVPNVPSEGWDESVDPQQVIIDGKTYDVYINQ